MNAYKPKALLLHNHNTLVFNITPYTIYEPEACTIVFAYSNEMHLKSANPRAVMTS